MSTLMAPDAAGLDEAFERIFREHYRMAYRTAFGILGNSEDADDAAQTIFLRLLNRDLPNDLLKHPKAYLYRAALNESLNIVRSKKRRTLTEHADCFRATPSSDEQSAQEMHQRLYEAVAKLSPGSAQILVLRYVHQYSLQEIARLLGTSRSTIAVSLFRSRARLRKWMRASSTGDSI